MSLLLALDDDPLSAAVDGAQSAQAGAIASELGLAGVVDGSQAAQGGQAAAEQEQPQLIMGGWAPPRLWARWPIVATVAGAQARQGGLIVGRFGPAQDIEVVFDWDATPEEIEEHLVMLMAMGISAGVSRIEITRGTHELVGVGSE